MNDYPAMDEFNDPTIALQVARTLTHLHGCKYTVTGGVNKFYAVRRLTPWEPTFLAWRRAFYREFGFVP